MPAPMPHFRGGPLPLPHMMPAHHPAMMRPPMFLPFPPPPPPPHLLPPMHPVPMMPAAPPPHFGMGPHLPPGIFLPAPPPPIGLLPPRFMGPCGPLPVPMGRARSPPDSPIVTGPESIYGTLPRRPAYEEPIYMPGNVPYMPPQASYQPGSYPADHYDAYYDTFKRQRYPQHSKGSGGAESQAGSRKAVPTSENDDTSQFWEAYEATDAVSTHQLQAFLVTARSMPSSTAVATTTAQNNVSTTRNNARGTQTTTISAGAVDIARPDTPPADYDGAAVTDLQVTANSSSTAGHSKQQQHTTAVIY
ncbi:unnamed protein product [Gongylonema pulchrum]|uniref:Pre-mRNA-processing protein 40C n=1 Tax=Gongylonema pulchrum TaxID=637853 RepID=A0A183CZU9_9BILA|nr:unnamed protein product [Gongylonema pulchrum]